MSQLPISPFLRAWYKWKMLRLPWRRQFLIGLDLNGNTYWEFLDRGSRLPSPDPARPQHSPVRWRRIVRYPRGTHHDAVVVPPAWHQWLRHTRADPPSLAEQQAEVARQARIKLLAAQADARWDAKPRVMEDAAAAAPRLSPSSPLGRAALGVREPALQTERPLGPGSKATGPRGGHAQTEVWGTGMGASTGTDTAARRGGRGAGSGAAGAAADDDAALRDRAGVAQREEAWESDQAGAAQREETWDKMRREEASARGGKAGADPWKQARGGPSETWQPKAWEPAPREKK